MGTILGAILPRFLIGIALKWDTEEVVDWIASGEREGNSSKASRNSGPDESGLVGVEEEFGNIQSLGP